MPNPEVTTVILIYVPTIWETTNRRYAFRALSDVLPEHVAVVCVDRPVDLAVSPLKRPRRFFAGIWRTRELELHERMVVVKPRLLIHEIPAAQLPLVTRTNRSWLRRQLQTVLQRRYPSLARILQWIHHPLQSWVYDLFPEAGKIYHCYDEYTCSPDGTVHPDRWEKEKGVLQRADLVFATSQSLLQRRKHLAKKSLLLPNGMPDFFFSAVEMGTDPIDHIPHPRIGYLGRMYQFLNYDLLYELCVRRPSWQLVLVGEVVDTSLVRKLKTLPNAHFMGPRPHERLPAVLPRFDVGLIPFIINEFTRQVRPLKLGEYLSAGIPVVSVDFPNLKPFKDAIRLVANDSAAFIGAIEYALTNDNPDHAARRKAFARQFTWRAINETRVVPALREVFDL